MTPHTYYSTRKGASLWIERKSGRWQMGFEGGGNFDLGSAATPDLCSRMLSFGVNKFPEGWIRVFGTDQ
jgi:hypothetical protein